MDRFSNTDFDLGIKAAFDGAEEEVPAHIWDAVASRLDAAGTSGKRRVIPVWLRNTGLLSAAVAAVALALVFTGTQDNGVPADTDGMIAVVEPAYYGENCLHSEKPEAREEMMPQDEDKLPAEKLLLPERTCIAEAVYEIQEKHDKEEASRPSGIPSSCPSITGNAKTDKWVDSFAFEDDAKKGASVAITLNGNATGKTGSGASAAGPMPMKTSSLRRPRKTISETGSSTYGIPISFGIGAKVSLTSRWSIGAGLNYTLLTRSFKGTYIDNSGIAEEYAKIRNNQNYIGIPVNAYFSIISNKKIDFYAYAGGTVEKCISNRYRMAPDIIYREKVKGLQFSANAGIGAEFIFADMLGLYIDPNIRYYFKDRNQPKSIRTENPLSFGCEIGLRVRL